MTRQTKLPVGPGQPHKTRFQALKPIKTAITDQEKGLALKKQMPTQGGSSVRKLTDLLRTRRAEELEIFAFFVLVIDLLSFGGDHRVKTSESAI